MHRIVCPTSFSPDPYSPGIRALAIRAAASRKIGVKRHLSVWGSFNGHLLKAEGHPSAVLGV
jgi:hypothetical protein